MIEPSSTLAFSMHANKGVYALLLGSGISRAARIPTGWEITIELVRKVAALQKADCEPDPAMWFQGEMEKQPDYSDLLDMVAKTPAERQQLLRSYWEPTETEREEGAKLPTRAHRAIADLVKLGYVRVLLTTNFDRLMEMALHDVGIQPVVLSTTDQIEGAMPLIHTPCTIIKIHGDYLDTRIKNTPEELATYPEPFNRLLDRVFDEFGLIVAGWSADWDVALRDAITRAPYRRFSTFWASRGEPSEKARELIARRGGLLVNIADADTFFGTLSEQVQALEEFSRPHPLSTGMAVATLKKYLSEPKYRIALDDLVKREVDSVSQVLQGEAFDVNSRDTSGAAVLAHLQRYEAASTTLIHLAFVAGQWSDGGQLAPWLKAMVKLAQSRANSGLSLWIDLQRYPATLLLYAFGLGAVANARWEALNKLFEVQVQSVHREDKRVVDLVPIWALFQQGAQVMQVLPGREDQYTPLNNHVQALLWSMFGSEFPSEENFKLAFDKFEMLTAMAHAVPSIQKSEHYWTLPGAYGWRRSNAVRIFAELRKELEGLGDASPLVSSGLVGLTATLGLKNLAQLEQFVPQLRWY
ncbi:SIR2 family protein [Delftia sp. WSY_7]|uniref:SIR2 family protein n=1 Tax=Delftia sp. WSY_7 TaxID=3367202 RepID=UPI00370A9C6F